MAIGELVERTQSWDEYPVGTIAFAVSGGYWVKIKSGGWKWCVGSTFPTPGADASNRVLIPTK